jgi:putative hydrolase of HD superfamily
LKNNRLEKQLQFILELDKLKTVLRRSYLTGGNRRENSAEHSWHIALMALLLSEHSNKSVNLLHVIKMLLVHDIVEIDAGDTYCYDQKSNSSKTEREKKAAQRIFGLLPEDQEEEMWKLWEEFEKGQTADSQFAAALDRLMPMLHNYHTQGRSWKEHNISKDQVIGRNAPIQEGSQILWKYIETIINDAVEKGYLNP